MKIVSSPVLPVLGWTKTVETLVASGPTLNWTAYALFVTVVWAYADTIHNTVESAVDAADDTLDDISDQESQE
jgi:hypothetical protein